MRVIHGSGNIDRCDECCLKINAILHLYWDLYMRHSVPVPDLLYVCHGYHWISWHILMCVYWDPLAGVLLLSYGCSISFFHFPFLFSALFPLFPVSYPKIHHLWQRNTAIQMSRRIFSELPVFSLINPPWGNEERRSTDSVLVCQFILP
jgi:hypothetical protein